MRSVVALNKRSIFDNSFIATIFVSIEMLMMIILNRNSDNFHKFLLFNVASINSYLQIERMW